MIRIVLSGGDDRRISMETDDLDSALALLQTAPTTLAAMIKALRNGKPIPKRKVKPKAIRSNDEPLSPQLVETWNWLVKHDSDQGVTPVEIAVGLKLAQATAVYRVSELVKKQLARRVRRGHYRAGDRD